MSETCANPDCGKPLRKLYRPRKTGLCTNCWGAKSLAMHRKPAQPREEKLAKQRTSQQRRILPSQIIAARRKVAMLETMAQRLGVEVPQ